MTLQQIANEAGVSTATVYRVVHGGRHVSARTLDRVKRAIKENGYYPSSRKINNGDGNGYVQNHFTKGSVGVVLADKPLEAFKVPFFAKLLVEIEEALSGYQVHSSIILVSDPDRDYPLLNNDRLDGSLLIGEPKAKQVRHKLAEMPVVGLFSSEHHEECSFDWVTPDFKSRGRLAINYLCKRGHRRLAFFNPMPDHMGFEESGIFFRLAANKTGAEVTMLVSEKPYAGTYWTNDVGRDRIIELVERFIKMPVECRPTGIYVVNEEICVNVYEEMQKRGIQIGNDVEFVSCGNDEEFLRKMDPRPATLDLNLPEIARRAVEKLIYRIKNPNAVSGITVSVPPRLVVPSAMESVSMNRTTK